MQELLQTNDEYAEKLNRLYRFLKAPRSLMGLVAGLLADAVEENFESEGRPKWLGLSKRTLRSRREAAGTGKILQRSGRLASSIVQSHDDESARVGTNVVYAAIHQFGGTIQRHPMSGMVRLRKDKNGMLLRQADHPHLAVFAKNGHKRVKVVKWTRSQGWTIKIPARPFLALSESDSAGIELEVSRYLQRLIDA